MFFLLLRLKIEYVISRLKMLPNEILKWSIKNY